MSENLLSNGHYFFRTNGGSKPSDFYDYAMYDADGNFVEGIKRADGNYSYGFQRYFAPSPLYAPYQIVDKYVIAKEINPAATSTIYMFSGCQFLETVEGHFNEVKACANMFAGCSSLKSVPDNFLNGVEVPASAIGVFYHVMDLSSWGNNTFNSITGTPSIMPNSVTGMKNIDGWATSFEMAKGIGNISSYTGFGTVTSNLIPIIEHFKNKTVPLTAYTAHMFKQFTAAADYDVCKASPIYSAWV